MRDNPLHVSALKHDTRTRTHRLNGMFALALPMILRKGVVLGAFSGNALVGIAGMVPPGRCQPTLIETVTLTPRMIPAIGFRAFARVGRWLATWGKHDLAEPQLVHAPPGRHSRLMSCSDLTDPFVAHYRRRESSPASRHATLWSIWSE